MLSLRAQPDQPKCKTFILAYTRSEALHTSASANVPSEHAIMKYSPYFSIRLITAVLVVSGLSAGLGTAYAQPDGKGKPADVLPLDRIVYGSSYADWSARWWQWLLSVPNATNPSIDPTGANCAEGQTGSVWFLVGTFGGSAERECTIPAGMALFFPVANTLFGASVGDCDQNVEGDCNVNTLRAAAAVQLDPPPDLEVTVDNSSVRHLDEFRVQAPVFLVTFPDAALFGFPSGTFSPNVSDGYWVMLPPLSAGQHTIHFTAQSSAFDVDVRYDLNIEP